MQYPKAIEPFVDKALKGGFDLLQVQTRPNGHLAITMEHKTRKVPVTLTCPSTPGDTSRGPLNFLSQLKKLEREANAKRTGPVANISIEGYQAVGSGNVRKDDVPEISKILFWMNENPKHHLIRCAGTRYPKHHRWDDRTIASKALNEQTRLCHFLERQDYIERTRRDKVRGTVKVFQISEKGLQACRSVEPDTQDLVTIPVEEATIATMALEPTSPVTPEPVIPEVVQPQEENRLLAMYNQVSASLGTEDFKKVLVYGLAMLEDEKVKEINKTMETVNTLSAMVTEFH